MSITEILLEDRRIRNNLKELEIDVIKLGDRTISKTRLLVASYSREAKAPERGSSRFGHRTDLGFHCHILTALPPVRPFAISFIDIILAQC